MRTLKTLKPGQKGTKALLARFGTNLLCVRYRYDEATGQRVKTVELIIQRRRSPDTHTPSPVARRGIRTQRPQPHPSPSRRVALRIGWRETDLRQRVKSAGGWWDPVRRVWILRQDQAERLDLLHRVVGKGGRGE